MSLADELRDRAALLSMRSTASAAADADLMRRAADALDPPADEGFEPSLPDPEEQS